MKHLKQFKMEVLLYSLLVGICAIGGFWGTYKLSQILGKNDEIKKQHPIPDMLLLDSDIEFSLDDRNTKMILEKVLSKTVLHGGDINKEPVVNVSAFFNEFMFKQSSIYKDNFSFEERLYNNLKHIYFNGIAKSQDNDTSISLSINDNTITLGSPNNKDRESYFEIISYNKEENIFKGRFHNIQLLVESHSKSEYLLDLKIIEYSFTGMEMHNPKLKNIVLKTYKTKYFRLDNIHLNEVGSYEAILIQTSV